MEVSSSSGGFSFIQTTDVPLSDLVDRMHANFVTLPEELCAASRPASPSSEARTAAWKNQIVHALQIAAGDTSHPKWGYVSRITKPVCTSRGYVGVAPGVKVGHGSKVKVGEDYQWVLPEVEKDWAGCEKKWEEAIDSQKIKMAAKASPQATRISKYWSKTPEAQPTASSSHAVQVPKKAALIREKVERWQAQVAKDPEDQPASQPTDVSQSPRIDKARPKAKAKVTHMISEKVQVPLGFPVVKRSSITDVKGGRGAVPRPHQLEGPAPPTQNEVPREASQSASPNDGLDLAAGPRRAEPATIADLSDFSFFPPSFPSQLLTSTPPPNPKRRKHETIAPCSPPPSSIQSPSSGKSFDPSCPQRRELPAPSSSAHAASPVQRPLKRARTPDTSAEHMLISTPAKAPPPKKARAEPFPEQEPTSSGPPHIPPSTPPPSTSPFRAPVTPVSKSKGLGNAKGLPVPTTPDPHPLPTLTELLASSRRSKPRPRPPSRKHTSQSHTGAKAAGAATAQLETASELPALAEDDDPEPSPTKTYFSSPASGSSDSMSVVHRSSVSPLFAHNPGAFAPAFTSTPRRSAKDDDPFLDIQSQSQGQGLARGSSGVFGMAYNSQFDVEGQVDRVSELLERDVDYNGWLRDLDDDEQPAQTQSQGAVGV
ncbi:hypothetical protein BC628DRAFT_481262 [Trametes gibbosa]|nr:hypothetical protein BC628DRAFT_481262 [Trametes gibbosa]